MMSSPGCRAAQNLEDLVDADEVKIGEFNTLDNVNISCKECKTRYGFTELLEMGSCRCRE